MSQWSLEALVAWLDCHIDLQDIPAGESAAFLRQAIQGLMAQFGSTDVGTLALDRFRLREQIEARIQQHRDAERKSAFQRFLLPASPLTVSPERAINFKTMDYEPSWRYEGGFQFTKHYFGSKPGELLEAWFYPDFICQLTDGRVLVVEYKGEHLFAEAGEKRAVGAVWESRSGGKCLFVMPEGPNMAAIESKIRGTG